MKEKTNATIHFMDGTNIVINYPKPDTDDPATITSNVKKALDKDKIVVEVDGSLLIIPVNNIKYVAITPMPDILPSDILRHGQIDKWQSSCITGN